MGLGWHRWTFSDMTSKGVHLLKVLVRGQNPGSFVGTWVTFQITQLNQQKNRWTYDWVSSIVFRSSVSSSSANLEASRRCCTPSPRVVQLHIRELSTAGCPDMPQLYMESIIPKPNYIQWAEPLPSRSCGSNIVRFKSFHFHQHQ